MATHTIGVTFRAAMSAIAILLFVGHAAAQSKTTVGSASKESPFAPLAGSWSGAGTIDLANGKHEPIKCRASYDVLEEQSKLQLNLHCASAVSYTHLTLPTIYSV